MRKPTRIQLLIALTAGLFILPVSAGTASGGEVKTVPLEIKALAGIPGRDKQWDWWQARTAFVPASEAGADSKPMWVTTMSETGRGGVHNFHDIYQSVSRDEGKTWGVPRVILSLKRARQK